MVEYAFAIAWAHFIVEKKDFAKALKEKQNAITIEGHLDRLNVDEKLDHTDEDTNGNEEIQIPKLKGYYFGNNSWYTWCGKFFDGLILLVYGKVDFYTDPFQRNKVDHIARLFFPVQFLFFIFLYCMITAIYWSANFYDNDVGWVDRSSYFYTPVGS